MQALITGINIEGLFGKFSYNIPDEGCLSSPSILYGDNGIGKSTILKLVFDILSPADNKGHRTALLNTEFSRLSVKLSNGHTVVAEKKTSLGPNAVRLTISLHEKILVEWIHVRKNTIPEGMDLEYHLYEEGLSLDNAKAIYDIYTNYSRNKRSRSRANGIKRGGAEFLSILRRISPILFYLNADRKLVSDVTEDDDDIRVRHLMRTGNAKGLTEVINATRSNSLVAALSNASRWVNKRAVSGANRGSENVHSVYESIIDHLAIDYESIKEDQSNHNILKLTEKINNIEDSTKNYSEYELAAPLKMDNFRRSIANNDKNAAYLSSQIITPYLESLETRLEAIKGVYDILNEFVTVVNGFLTGKEIKYKQSQGFYIIDENGNTLEAAHLSSGEKQLLLIFSHVLATKDESSVFIIDEPEISLNVKWQRHLISSLLRIVEGDDVQFIFASHSIELISQHRKSVQKLIRK